MRVAVLYNLKHSITVRSDAPADVLAEYDSEETVQAIADALSSHGHDAIGLEADETLIDTLRAIRPDICFNIAEGLRGDAREAQTPALLEMLGIPYTGSKVLAQAISLDKAMSKRVWRDAGLATTPFQVFRTGDEPLRADLGFPLFVKPVREGSGMGISRSSVARDEADLRDQVRWVIATYAQPALAEGYLPGREFTVGLIGNARPSGSPPRSEFYDARGFHLFPVLEIDPTVGAGNGTYNTAAKSYLPGEPGAPLYLCPADISRQLEAELKRLAVRAFEEIGALDVSRVDFRLGEDGHPYLMEINTLPGLNPIVSDLCIMARAELLPYRLLIDGILRLAIERYAAEGVRLGSDRVGL